MKQLFFCLLLGVAGCRNEADKVDKTLVRTDFETLAGWLPAPQNELLSRDQAHSGTYAIKVDPQHEYSLTYHAPLEALSGKRFSKLKIGAWVLVPNAQAQAKLVVVLSEKGENSKELLWEGIDVQQAVTGQYGRWVKLEKDITLPAGADGTSQLAVYLWRTDSNTTAFLDDLTLQNNTPAE